jgi:hypothetical protein
MPGILVGLCLGTAWAVEQRTFTIQEPFGLAWGPDRVCYVVEFPQGQVSPNGVALTDAGGKPVAVQLSMVSLWPDKTVKSAAVSFMAALQPNEKGVWNLTASRKKAKPVETDLKVESGKKTIQLETARTGIRLVGGSASFEKPVTGDDIPAFIQAVRLPGGKWIGKGSWRTDIACTGYKAEVIETGPVFAHARLHYDFERGKSYFATVELSAGQDIAVLIEEYNLSEGKRYPMTGSNGMKPDVLYGYVYPRFESPERALLWDWWAQTMAVLPTPNVYVFGFNEGLSPDSAEFYGRSMFGNLLEGDGGLRFDKDGRFAYINAYLQWGDEETLYLGLYNSKNPAPMLAVVALRPSQWLHPDIDPHPNALLKQYVQTTCLTFERRKSGEAFFRAPVCLGKRVYGIGGMERTLAKHVIPDRGGPKLTEKEVWGSEIMSRHVRLGRLGLNTLKHWVLDYDEPAKYPRLYVPEGDRVRYESRRSRKPVEEVKKELQARTAPTEADKKVVQDALARTSHLVRHFAQSDKGHMDYGIEEGVYADLCEDALSSPACTPEQARELRKWLAAISYFAMHPDFVPPREAGFAWGSANMMAQVQCRACRIVSLLPNHPEGKVWRQHLAKVVTLYVEDQINEGGCTLECPHYGGMAITMPAMGLAALASCDGVDLSRAGQRLKAAARMRLGTLLPPDVRGGYRSQCPEGDGYYDSEYTLGTLAGFFQKSDPELSRQLAWGVKESNNFLGGHSDSSFKLVDVGLEPFEPKLGSAHYPGHGFVMRNGFPRPDEAYVQVYAGAFSWGHGHSDRGTWVMYAKGAPLMMDFAAMYTPSMREQWMHPGGLTFNHDDTVRPGTDEPKDRWWKTSPNADYRNLKTAPFTVIEPRAAPDAKSDLDTFGQVTSFRSLPQADYAEMKRNIRYLARVPYILQNPHGKDLFDDGTSEEVWLKTPFTWTRRFVFVKDADPMGHNYLVIRDDLPGNGELDPYLNLWCLADKLDVQGQVAVYTGQHGVDLHCYVAEPATFTPKTSKLGHPCGFGFAQHYRTAFKKDFREDQLQLQIPQTKRDGGYFVAMVPVKQGEVAPKFETVAAGKAVKVVFPDRTDTVLLQKEPAEVTLEGRTLTGAAVLMTSAGGQMTVTDLAEGR